MDGGLRPLLGLMMIVDGGIILQQQPTMTIKRPHRTLVLAGEVVGVVVVAAVVGEIDAWDEDLAEEMVTAAMVADITPMHREEPIAGRTKSPARITRPRVPVSRGFGCGGVVVG